MRCGDSPCAAQTQRNPAVLEAAGGYPPADALTGRRCAPLHHPAPCGAGHDVIVAIVAGSRRLGLSRSPESLSESVESDGAVKNRACIATLKQHNIQVGTPQAPPCMIHTIDPRIHVRGTDSVSPVIVLMINIPHVAYAFRPIRNGSSNANLSATTSN